jgi:electron transfer flavoprotein beta subunit
MNVLVCVKRVPSTGARLTLKEDQQELETRNLGFTIGPHEECAVEEAIRIIEAHGGSSTVMTLGGEESIEQLRDALALGIENGILLETDGSDWDPMAVSAAIVSTIESEREKGNAFDLILLGNEAADTGGYQVGIRVATALNLPCVTGIKSLDIADGMATAKRERSGGWETFEVALPAVFTVKEGINLPRYPSLPGRMRAKRKPIESLAPAHQPGGPRKRRLRTPEEQDSEVEILGRGPEAAAEVLQLLKEMGLV